MEHSIQNLQLPRSRPEKQGIPSTAISAFLKTVEDQQLGLHSFMLLRHGHVVAEGWWSPYQSDIPHMLFSLSKSFTSTAIGLAVSAKLFTLDDSVISFFPEESLEVFTENLAKMSVRHLLTMGTGHTEDTMDALLQSKDGHWVRAFLELPVTEEPGSRFVYNSGASYMLSAILQKASGSTLLQYLDERLLAPLGIRGAEWDSCPRGINTGGFGLSLTTEAIAKFGQLYLQQGVWNKQQLVPKEWISEAASKQIPNGDGSDNDWALGYGYQFWMCKHGAYRADGAFGQLCIVMPDQDAVVICTSGSNDVKGILDAVWAHLLVGMESYEDASAGGDPVITTDGGGPATAADSDPAAAAALSAHLNTMAVNPPRLHSSSSVEDNMDGQIYRLENNEAGYLSFSIAFAEQEATVTLHNKLGEHILRAGRGEWLASSYGGAVPYHVQLHLGG